MSEIEKLKFEVACLKQALRFGHPTFYEDYSHKSFSTLLCCDESMQKTMKKCLDYDSLIYEDEFENEQYRFGWIKWIETRPYDNNMWSQEAIVAVIKHFIKKKYIKALSVLDEIDDNNLGTFFDAIYADGYLDKSTYICAKELIGAKLNPEVSKLVPVVLKDKVSLKSSSEDPSFFFNITTRDGKLKKFSFPNGNFTYDMVEHACGIGSNEYLLIHNHGKEYFIGNDFNLWNYLSNPNYKQDLSNIVCTIGVEKYTPNSPSESWHL